MAESEIVVAVLTILGAGFSSYVAVKVALAEHAARIASLEENQKEIRGRIGRLEAGYFPSGKTE